MGSERTLLLTELETWALEDMIRHTWVDEGRPVGKNLLLKVFTLIDEFESRRMGGPRELALALTEDECWAIDFHIRRSHVDPSGVRIGKDLLLKVFRMLLEMRASEEVKHLGLREAASAGPSESETRPRLQELRDYLERERGRDDETATSDDSPS